jgi:hypothetical protein
MADDRKPIVIITGTHHPRYTEGLARAVTETGMVILNDMIGRLDDTIDLSEFPEADAESLSLTEKVADALRVRLADHDPSDFAGDPNYAVPEVFIVDADSVFASYRHQLSATGTSAIVGGFLDEPVDDRYRLLNDQIHQELCEESLIGDFMQLLLDRRVGEYTLLEKPTIPREVRVPKRDHGHPRSVRSAPRHTGRGRRK